jgi:hypothetical protein
VFGKVMPKNDLVNKVALGYAEIGDRIRAEVAKTSHG